MSHEGEFAFLEQDRALNLPLDLNAGVCMLLSSVYLNKAHDTQNQH